jgi:hypothetical protein
MIEHLVTHPAEATAAFLDPVELGPALLATLSTLAGVWLTHHFQLKTKKTELDAQAKLKARELIFNSYQQKLDRKREALSKASSGMGQFIAQVKLGSLSSQSSPPHLIERWPSPSWSGSAQAVSQRLRSSSQRCPRPHGGVPLTQLLTLIYRF